MAFCGASDFFCVGLVKVNSSLLLSFQTAITNRDRNAETTRQVQIESIVIFVNLFLTIFDEYSTLPLSK